MRVLLTAFEPYDQWQKNSSWEALVAMLSERGASPDLVTRRYPVDLPKLQARIEMDLADGIDAVLHLGQAPGASKVHLESIAINVAGVGSALHGVYPPLVEAAPVAYRTEFPVGEWAKALNSSQIPASVSYHAGTYLCNAAMFLSHDWFARRQRTPLVGFVHLPLTPEQSAESGYGNACMSVQQTSQAVGLIIDRIRSVPSHGSTALA